LSILGYCYLHTGHPADALHSHKQSAALAELTGDHLGRAAALRDVGRAFSHLQEDDSAAVYYRKALASFGEMGAFAWSASTCRRIGNLHSQATEFDSAYDYVHRALEFDSKAGYQRGTVADLHCLGEVYIRDGQHDSAVAVLQRAYDLSLGAGFRVAAGYSLMDIGRSYFAKSERDSARAYYGMALSMVRGKDRNCEGALQGNIGHLLANPDSALWHHREALAIFEDTRDREGVARTLVHIAGDYLDKKMTDSALAYCRRATALYRQLGERGGVAYALAETGRIFRARREIDTALTYFTLAIDTARAARDRLSLAKALAGRGLALLFERDDTDAALPDLLAADDILRALGMEGHRPATWGNIVHLPQRMGRERFIAACLVSGRGRPEAEALFDEITAARH